MQDEVRKLVAQLDAQQQLIAQLEERLAKMEGAPTAGPSGPTIDEPLVPVGAAADVEIVDAATGRRQMLRRAVTLAAGAAAGGAALTLGTSSPAAAASGTFDGDPAVLADGSGAGSTALRVLTSNGGTHISFTGSSNPSFGTHSAGDMIKDAVNDVYFCITGGSPGVWRKVTGLFSSGAFYAVAKPYRAYDSRAGELPATGPKGLMAPGTTRTVDLTLNSGAFLDPDRVSTSAQAAVINVTVVNTSASGFLTVWRAGITRPSVSTVNWFQTNSIVANEATVRLDGTTGTVQVYAQNTCNFIIDVIGYFR